MIGVLLINTGSPKEPTPKEVRRYLKQFLSDKRVIDIPALWRYLLVNFLILPRRSYSSAEAYQKIWQKGSPLILNTLDLQKKLSVQLGKEYAVEIAMRYGEPSIAQGLNNLIQKNVERIIVLPLFPQYASASTGSAVEEVYKQASQLWNIVPIEVRGDFYNEPHFIQAVTHKIQKHNFDFLLFSYHGLPQRHVQKSDNLSCNTQDPCPVITHNNRYCYRAQCYATTQSIVKTLNVPNLQYTVSFQSRLGRTPWIQPYTDKILPELKKRGVKRLAVVCPSFVADCLETLEEIGMRLKQDWLALGGESLELIPCVNSDDLFVSSVEQMILADKPATS